MEDHDHKRLSYTLFKMFDLNRNDISLKYPSNLGHLCIKWCYDKERRMGRLGLGVLSRCGASSFPPTDNIVTQLNVPSFEDYPSYSSCTDYSEAFSLNP